MKLTFDMMRRYLAPNNKVKGGIIAILLFGAYTWKKRSETSHVEPNVRPDGDSKNMTTLMLETGSKLMQRTEPLNSTSVYFVGFHPMSDDPRHQMEAHHYCKQVNEDFAQCLLYDGNTKNANLTGLEYIISEKLFKQLPGEEVKFWHPHNYEILSGQLVAPGLPSVAEKSLMKKNMNSYGKTFHTWRAKCWEGEKPYLDTLPKGDAILAWSFNHDGEVKPDLIETRDKNMGINTSNKKKEREHLVHDAHPQKGVDLLKLHFKQPGTQIEASPNLHPPETKIQVKTTEKK